jgi:hypothetical protein
LGVGDGGQPRLKAVGVREDAQRRETRGILDLRFAILAQNAKTGSLTFEVMAQMTDGHKPPTTARACLILRGKKIKYAAIGELLGGNTRQGIGPSSAYCRVLPGIAA